jgi:transposase-like protein
MKPRKHSPDEKLSVVLEILKSGKSISQICKEHHIHDSLAYRWRDEALEGMKHGLSQKKPKQTPSADRERLLKIIGQQTVIIDFQKKISEELSL